MERRTILAVALSFLVFMIWANVFAPKPPPPKEPTGTTGEESAPRPPAESEPATASEEPTSPTQPALSFTSGEAAPEQTITVETELYRAVFSSRGAGLVSFVPLLYPAPDGGPLELIAHPGAQPVLGLDPDGEGPSPTVEFSDTVFDVSRRAGSGMTVEELVFSAASGSGTRIERSFRFVPDDYTMEMTVKVSGLPGVGSGSTTQEWNAGLPVTEHHEGMDLTEFGAMVRVGDNVEQTKLNGGGFGCSPGSPTFGTKEYEGIVRWAATRTRYFIAGLFATNGGADHARVFGNREAHRVGYSVTAPVLEGATATTYRLYVGPIEVDRLKALGEGIEKKVGFATMPMGGMLGWFGEAIYKAMRALYSVIPNYGVVIILLAILLKLLLLPLSRRSTASMRAFQEINQELQPQLQELKKKYGNDPQRMNAETMALYKKYGVNPLGQMGGCLWMLPQFPVFMALWAVFRTSIELRQAPFLLWINDLSAPDVLFNFGTLPGPLPDQLHVLPILMAITTILMQKRTITDPRQKSLMYMMPVMMLFFFYGLPAGLNLYWTVTNLLSWGEQLLVKGKTSPAAAKAA